MARAPVPAAADQSLALFDSRPFFEKALQHGLRHGLFSPEKLAALRQEGPKGMVQIARYFGTEYLRPDLERARDRLVNLVSLYLEETSGGDLQRAAEDLRDHSLLSRSKGGSEMLKALIAMPQNTHFGMQERAGFRDEHIPLLAKWSLRSLPEVHAERARRTQAARTVGAALWMAAALDMAGRHSFDLLISDLGLPDGSGHDLLRELRARGHQFPAIALSGYGQAEDVRRSYEAGFAAHLTKPASREAVVEKIGEVANT